MNKAELIYLVKLLHRHSWYFVSTVAGLTCTLALLYFASQFLLALVR